MVAQQQQPATDTTRATVFDIRLLTDLIARHLTTRDIYGCTLVNRHFHSAFQQSLYTCISIESEATRAKFTCKEARGAFSRYFSQLRQFSTRFGDCVVDLLNEARLQCILPQGLGMTSVLFNNLTTLRYRPEHMIARAADLELYSDSILSILETSPELQDLHISNFAHSSKTLVLRLATIIREKGRRLKYLCVEGSQRRIDDTLFYTLLWSCAAVEVLHMDLGPKYRPRTSSAKSLPIFRSLAREALYNTSLGSHPVQLEEAEISECSQGNDSIEFAWKELGPGSWLVQSTMEMVHELLQMCPFLERMVLPKLNEDIITQLALIVATAMPRLRHLDLTDISHQRLGPYRLVQSCKDLVSLNLGSLQYNSPFLVDTLVLGHGHSLQSLRIHWTAKLSSQQLSRILSSCRGLKALYVLTPENDSVWASNEPLPGWTSLEPLPAWPSPAPHPILNTKDMAIVPEELGWGCMDLETLQLCYNNEDTNIGISEVLWRQIRQLSQLRDLKLHRYPAGQVPPVQEKESVRMAVSSWTALSDLRRLELRGLDEFIEEALVDAVGRHWPQLEWVRCNCD